MYPAWLDAVNKSDIDWEMIENDFPFWSSMAACIQDPVHHAEGDVATHTKMVATELKRFKLFSIGDRLTALFHDVEKPATRVIEDGQVRHPKHARYGAHTAWVTLWKAGVDVETRLAVYPAILWHQRVFHLWDYPDLMREAQHYAAIGDIRTLIDFARADNAGRICADPRIAEDNLCLLREWVDENLTPLDPASRVAYFENKDRSVHYAAQAPVGSRVTILSGLPGAGKDYHIRNNHPDVPVISLDAIRRELSVSWTDDQGHVIQTAFERAREHLRARRPFVWNAHCTNRLLRRKIIQISRDYDAHVTIDALDVPYEMLLRQNRDRDFPVPENVIESLIAKWEPPMRDEAHDVRWFER